MLHFYSIGPELYMTYLRKPDRGRLTPPISRACFREMCRNIRPLFNFEPPTTDVEIQAAALQFVRKISGFTKPSHANEAAFDQAVRDVSLIARKLIDSLHSSAPPKDRAVEAEKGRERSRIRFGERGTRAGSRNLS